MGLSNPDFPDSYKIVDGRRDHGLEVGVDPTTRSSAAWPSASQSVWGSSDQDTCTGFKTSSKEPEKNSGGTQKKEEEEERRRIAGYPIEVFWAVIGILVVAIAAGLGAGLGAGLSRKSSCSSEIDDGSGSGNMSSSPSEISPSPPPANCTSPMGITAAQLQWHPSTDCSTKGGPVRPHVEALCISLSSTSKAVDIVSLTGSCKLMAYTRSGCAGEPLALDKIGCWALSGINCVKVEC